ncbi:MAG: hypothetical protein ACJAXH_003376 [Colwellia sp.]
MPKKEREAIVNNFTQALKQSIQNSK